MLHRVLVRALQLELIASTPRRAAPFPGALLLGVVVPGSSCTHRCRVQALRGAVPCASLVGLTWVC